VLYSTLEENLAIVDQNIDEEYPYSSLKMIGFFWVRNKVFFFFFPRVFAQQASQEE